MEASTSQFQSSWHQLPQNPPWLCSTSVHGKFFRTGTVGLCCAQCNGAPVLTGVCEWCCSAGHDQGVAFILQATKAVVCG